jgi:ferredoxin--NADP+ reductase
LNIPGIDLQGSHAATEFVAWYNGHPDYRDCQFDLTQKSVAVVGVGNVAVDVCRILSRTPEELAVTDIADYALEALRESQVKDVYMLGRRGVAQAAFTAPEVKELGEMEDADVVVLEDEVSLGPLSAASMGDADRGTTRKVEIVQGYAGRPLEGKSHRLHLRFLVSPVELIGDENGQVVAMRLVKNELYETDAGTLRPRATDQYEEIPVGLVFRSIGYRGVPLEGVPFNDNWGVIWNTAGRVIDPETKAQLVGQYVAGWIKRGPSGVIGTNKPDAAETADNMIADVAAGKINQPAHPEPEAIEKLLEARKPDYFSYADWQALDELETAAGETQGRPRVKFVSIEEMLEAREKLSQ